MSQKRGGMALRNLLCGHEGVVSHLAWAPVGHALGSCSLDQTLRLWDRQGERAQKVIRAHDFNVTGLAWAPQGNALATVSDDRRILLWAYPSGDPLGCLEGHNEGICMAAWSPNGNHIVTVANSREARVWNVGQKGLKCVLRGHQGVLRGLAFTTGGDFLATVSDDTTVRLWRGSGYTPDKKLVGHTAPVNAAAFGPDGTLATVSDDQTIRIWNVRKGKCIQVINGHVGPVKAVAFSAGGRLLATRSWDQTLRIWRCDTWRDVAVVEEESASPFATLAFHPTLPVLASVGALDRVIRIWELDMEGLARAEPASDTIHFHNEENALLRARGFSHLGVGGQEPEKPRMAPITPALAAVPQQSTNIPQRFPSAQPAGSSGRVFLCSNCREPITESQANRRLEFGHRTLRCPVCDMEVPLVSPSLAATQPLTIPTLPPPPPTGLRDWAGADRVFLTLLFTDIVGSTHLANRVGGKEMNKMRRSHFLKAREHIQAHGGFEIKTMGDAFMVVFKTVHDGFDCALKLNGDTGHPEIAVRAGLHLGEVDIEENDCFGLMVNFCARIVSQAAGPEIWLSEEAWNRLLREDTQRYANLPWTCNENVPLKGFPDSYRLWAL